jgi:hypothetical protein
MNKISFTYDAQCAFGSVKPEMGLVPFRDTGSRWHTSERRACHAGVLFVDLAGCLQHTRTIVEKQVS